MSIKKINGYGIALYLLLVFLLLSACTSDQAPSTSGNGDTYPVDPLLKGYYRDLGGEQRLGPAISRLLEDNDSQCQYMVNVLMCYNPLATGTNRFYLTPLESKLDILEFLGAAVGENNLQIQDKYTIYADFMHIYQELNGALTVGRPLTGVYNNYDQQRIEQYFENIGFYQSFDDLNKEVNLIPYGVYMCGLDCDYQTSEVEPILAVRGHNNIPFAKSLNRLGGVQVFGQPLTQPYEAEDGNLEQVFENVVICAPINNSSAINLRPLPTLIGMVTTPPGEKEFGVSDNVVFYPVKGELGYHVPVAFDQFIAQHGGLKISGNPIAEVMIYSEDKIVRQCFEYYCLDYHSDAAEHQKTRLAPLGIMYLDRVGSTSAAEHVFSPDTIHLALWEEEIQISPQDEQKIYLLVTHEVNNSPVVNIEARITLTTPNGNQLIYYTPATDEDGQTSMVIPVIPDLENGNLIIYKVCLNVPSETPICAYDSYLIWDTK